MTQTPPGQINRTGSVWFGNAAIRITEEGLGAARRHGGFSGEKEWSAAFKRDVFTRIIQTLNRIGWTCKIPPVENKMLGASYVRTQRDISKGHLKGHLSITGRCVGIEFWQSVNTPTRPDHGGKYEHDKEGVMPYAIRLEMERTRRRIRDYLCNVFTGYEFQLPNNPAMGLMGMTATEKAAHARKTSGHYVADLDRARISNEQGARSADQKLIEQGSTVWANDASGRVITGVAYYSLNSRWAIVTGRYGLTYVDSSQIYIDQPAHLRIKRNADIRRKRLEQELDKAVASLDFKRAQVLKGVLFPAGPLYAIYHKEKAVYFGTMYRGYHDSLTAAGKYTRAELKPYLGEALENKRFNAVLISE